MKKIWIAFLLVGVLMVVTACAAGPNELAGSENPEGDVAGFWRGLWHGIIAPITFVVSLFNDNVAIYEVHNNGGWYDFGFLAGVVTVFGGGGGAGGRRSRR